MMRAEANERLARKVLRVFVQQARDPNVVIPAAVAYSQLLRSVSPDCPEAFYTARDWARELDEYRNEQSMRGEA